MIEDPKNMKKFGVKVDLSEFFKDERKTAVILVDPQWLNVECLQQKMQTLFDLQPVHFMNEEGCYIPLKESVDILQLTSLVKAFLPGTIGASKKHKKEKRKRKSSQNDENNAKKPKESQNTPLSSSVAALNVSNSNNKHVHFADSVEIHAIKPKTFINFRCELEGQSSTQPRIFPVRKIIPTKTTTQIIELTQNNENIPNTVAEREPGMVDDTQTVLTTYNNNIENVIGPQIPVVFLK